MRRALARQRGSRGVVLLARESASARVERSVALGHALAGAAVQLGHVARDRLPGACAVRLHASEDRVVLLGRERASAR
eukprot:5247377-Prymnesium_polylepis.1